ncbi:MAG: ATP-binding protein, partial [Caldilineaceae bacterium]
DTQRVWVDVVEFGRLIQQGADQQAVALYQADFLTGFNLSLSYEFEAWALREQSRLKSQMVDLLRRLATQQEANSKRSEAISTVRRLLDLEPWHEEVHRWLMVLLAKDGQRSAALAHFVVCKKLLQEELGVDPSEETQALYQHLQKNSVLHNNANADESIEKSKLVTSQSYHLPVPLTPFIGRAKDLAKLTERLQRERLITLIGPPGVGKTRLAIQAANTIVKSFHDGIYFIPLAAVRDPALAPVVTCQLLGLQESGLTVLDRLKFYLGEKHLLLILDNFEQILASTLSNDNKPLLWINDLLSVCPKLHILVTSRAPLRLRAERQYTVQPLELPKLTAVTNIEALATIPSIQLFAERAQAIQSDFAITAQNVNDVAALCIRLDGLPLAIELVAARIQMLSPARLLERLNHRLVFMSNSLRDSPAHQQTLYHAILWSYELLSQDEQTLFMRLAVFAGGFTLEAAEAICLEQGMLSFDIVDGVASLLEKSLLTQRVTEEGARLGMLELIREFARERLEATSEFKELRRIHALYYLHLAEEADPHLRSAEQLIWFQRLEVEQYNFRAILEWSVCTKGYRECGLRLVKALGWFWFVRSYYGEGIQWIEQLLAISEEEPSILAQAWAYSTASMLATGIDNFDQGLFWGKQALTVADEWQDIHLRTHVVPSLVTHLFCRGELQTAKRLVQETWERLDFRMSDPWTVANICYLSFRVSEDSTELRRFFEQGKQIVDQIGDRWLVGIFHCCAERLIAESGDVTGAFEIFQKYYEVAHTLQDGRLLLFSLDGLGSYAYLQGRLEEAESYFRQALDKARQMGTSGAIASLLRYLGHIAYRRGEFVSALSYYRQALNWIRDLGFNLAVANTLPPVARILDATGQTVAAIRLIGATEAIYPIDRLNEDPDAQAIVVAAHAQIEDPIHAKAWEEGQQMGMEQAIAYTLALIESFVGQAETQLESLSQPLG